MPWATSIVAPRIPPVRKDANLAANAFNLISPTPVSFDRTFRNHQLVTGSGAWFPAEYLFIQCKVSNRDQLCEEVRFFMLEVRANVQNALAFRTYAPEYQAELLDVFWRPWSMSS